MPKHSSARYCADPEALMAMKRDGLGWGHDLECGCFHDTARPTKPGPLARIVTSLKRRT
ncbi:MAG: hypothetical protein AAFN63_14705 [Pseudomonadota bacterium]